MAKHDFTIQSTFTETISAGTAVWFRAVDAKLSRKDLIDRYELAWEVSGPFPKETVTDAGTQDRDDPTLFTVRTDDFSPGAYDITCIRVPKPGAPEPVRA